MIRSHKKLYEAAVKHKVAAQATVPANIFSTDVPGVDVQKEVDDALRYMLMSRTAESLVEKYGRRSFAPKKLENHPELVSEFAAYVFSEEELNELIGLAIHLDRNPF